MTAFSRLATASLGTALLIAMTALPAHSVAGDTGHDVSSPQCGGALPGTGSFGIVGVTAGLPFAANPCLAPQAAWAAGTGSATLYVNTANPGHTSPHWSAVGRTSPARCVAVASDTDTGCAYDYGWDAALDALAIAQRDAAPSINPLAVPWWLDVEGSRTPSPDGNSWKGSPAANAADLQGYVDALRFSGVRRVGIYSTAMQWADITGGYSRATANARRAAWAFAVRSPLEDGPVWFAGLDDDVVAAAARCASPSFTGGQRLLSQFTDGAFDGDVRCGDPDTVAPTVVLTGPTGTATSRSTVLVSWRGSDTGGAGLASYDIRVRAHAAKRAFGAYSSPVSWRRFIGSSLQGHVPTVGGTYCFSVRSRDAAGNVSAWSAERCVVRR